MATIAGKIEIPIEATVKIRVGDHEVKLADLAAALTKAGVELQALATPRSSVSASTYASAAEHVEHVCRVDELRPGEGVYRDRQGYLRTIELDHARFSSRELPRIIAVVTGGLTSSDIR